MRRLAYQIRKSYAPTIIQSEDSGFLPTMPRRSVRMLRLIHERQQLPVGQGGFHTGRLLPLNETLRDENQIRYVYDCGTKGKFAPALKREIDGFKAGLNKATLDFLFLSHLHSDHISGVTQLFQGDDGVAVDTIVMPFLNDQERLFSFTDSIFEPTAEADLGLLRAITVDPVEAFSDRFDPRQILVIGPEEELPGIDPETPINPLTPRPTLEGTAKWRVVDDGAFADRSPTSSSGVTLVQRASRRARVEIDFAEYEWVLLPYLPAFVQGIADDFWQAVCEKKSLDPADYPSRQVPRDLMLELLDDLQTLKSAYHLVSKNLNASSMSLYSGPKPPRRDDLAKPPTYLWRSYFGGGWTTECAFGPDVEPRVGWLGTGDGDFGSADAVTELANTLNHHAQRVISMSLPHHGAADDFDVSLLTTLNPSLAAVAADFMQKKWRHPAPEVVHALAAERVALACVTSDERTRLTEEVWIEANTGKAAKS